MSKIEWTDETWNPIVGCSKVSPGCKNCYAIRDAHRMAGNPNLKISSVYEGLTARNGEAAANWTGQVKFIEQRLSLPLYWSSPRMVFVNSMSDLFHEDVQFAVIEKIFEVMMHAGLHTFQVLTKRPRRMYDFWQWCKDNHLYLADHWPLPNVWLGVSVENQEYANERIPWLLKIPAAIKFLSCEPLLERVDISIFLATGWTELPYDDIVNWMIVGGESGPNARSSDIDWFDTVIRQCQAAEIPVFMKQLGNHPQYLSVENGELIYRQWPVTGKGGDPEEWPEFLRIRQFPEVPHAP